MGTGVDSSSAQLDPGPWPASRWQSATAQKPPGPATVPLRPRGTAARISYQAAYIFAASKCRNGSWRHVLLAWLGVWRHDRASGVYSRRRPLEVNRLR